MGKKKGEKALAKQREAEALWIQEQIENRKILQDQYQKTRESLDDLRTAIKSLDLEIIKKMNADGSKKLYTPSGAGVSLKTINDRQYNAPMMLSLKDRVPAKLWEAAHEEQIVHKFKWAGVKKLLELGGEIRHTIEEAIDCVEKQSLEIITLEVE